MSQALPAGKPMSSTGRKHIGFEEGVNQNWASPAALAPQMPRRKTRQPAKHSSRTSRLRQLLP